MTGERHGYYRDKTLLTPLDSLSRYQDILNNRDIPDFLSYVLPLYKAYPCTLQHVRLTMPLIGIQEEILLLEPGIGIEEGVYKEG